MRAGGSTIRAEPGAAPAAALASGVAPAAPICGQKPLDTAKSGLLPPTIVRGIDASILSAYWPIAEPMVAGSHHRYT